MNIKRLALVFLMSLVQISCTENTKKISVVAITYDYGDYVGRIYISVDKINAESIFKNDTTLVKNIFLRSMNIYTIEQKTLEQISEYVENNCNLNMNIEGSRSFIIQVYSGMEKVHECYLSENEKINNYFSNLVKELEKYPSKENIYVIKALKSHIR